MCNVVSAGFPIGREVEELVITCHLASQLGSWGLDISCRPASQLVIKSEWGSVVCGSLTYQLIWKLKVCH